jgi:hypothetical protein
MIRRREAAREDRVRDGPASGGKDSKGGHRMRWRSRRAGKGLQPGKMTPRSSEGTLRQGKWKC